MTTTSTTPGFSAGPAAVLPLMIRTSATRSLLETNPTKDRPLSAGGAKIFAIDSPALLKYSTDVVAARSTSVNIAPNALVVAGISVPALKKCTSVIVLPSDANNRGALNGVKITG